jgi:hypothetical protein
MSVVVRVALCGARRRVAIDLERWIDFDVID